MEPGNSQVHQIILLSVETLAPLSRRNICPANPQTMSGELTISLLDFSAGFTLLSRPYSAVSPAVVDFCIEFFKSLFL